MPILCKVRGWGEEKVSTPKAFFLEIDAEDQAISPPLPRPIGTSELAPREFDNATISSQSVRVSTVELVLSDPPAPLKSSAITS